MAFPKSAIITPSAIGDVSITLTNRVDGTHGYTFNIVVLDAGGNVMLTVQGDLEPQLTATQLTTISNFLANLRTKAQTEVLP